jgi:hypothetical protein
MLKYNDLTKAQKRFVDAIVKEDPSIKKTGTATRKQIESLYWTLNEKRADGGEKVGFPNWLTGPNKISRGIYQIPMAEKVAATVKATAKAERTKLENIIAESDVAEDYAIDEDTFNPEDEEARMVMAEIAGR